MNEVFEGMIGQGVHVYIDDVTIYSRTFDEHITILQEVLKRLRKFNFFMKPSKCTFVAKEVKLLGHMINAEGVKPTEDNIAAVQKYPRPTTKTELQAFLGLINYYRNFVKDCARKTEPLTKMLRKDVKFEWNPTAEQVFQWIKKVLTSDIILTRPNFDKTFILHTDGSALGLGAVLSQMDPQGNERPLAYASRRTSRTEAKYGATQLELLAVVWAVTKFHHYLIGRPFQLVTDHQALKTLIKMEHPPALFAQWIMRLMPYEIDLITRPGKKHQNADALSRGFRTRFIERLETQYSPFRPRTKNQRLN
jgi:hypothetical protein